MCLPHMGPATSKPIWQYAGHYRGGQTLTTVHSDNVLEDEHKCEHHFKILADAN